VKTDKLVFLLILLANQ